MAPDRSVLQRQKKMIWLVKFDPTESTRIVQLFTRFRKQEMVTQLTIAASEA